MSTENKSENRQSRIDSSESNSYDTGDVVKISDRTRSEYGFISREDPLFVVGIRSSCEVRAESLEDSLESLSPTDYERIIGLDSEDSSHLWDPSRGVIDVYEPDPDGPELVLEEEVDVPREVDLKKYVLYVEQRTTREWLLGSLFPPLRDVLDRQLASSDEDPELVTDGGESIPPDVDEDQIETGERILKSPITDELYRVTKWVELDEGQYLAIDKERYEPESLQEDELVTDGGELEDREIYRDEYLLITDQTDVEPDRIPVHVGNPPKGSTPTVVDGRDVLDALESSLGGRSE
jgi:hypothetical protein